MKRLSRGFAAVSGASRLSGSAALSGASRLSLAAVFAMAVFVGVAHADETISASVTLVADRVVSGVLTVESGVVIDLAGYRLTSMSS